MALCTGTSSWLRCSILLKQLQLPIESVAVQAENKAAWNGRRSFHAAEFFTVGYSGRTHLDLVALLKKAGIAAVLDIRHAAVSMYRPEFSKSNLRDVLARADIDYMHLPEWGVPKDVRGRAVGKPDRSAIWEWYDTHVLPTVGLHRFMNFADHPVALLCVELDPTACHRHRLAEHLEDHGLRGYDL